MQIKNIGLPNQYPRYSFNNSEYKQKNAPSFKGIYSYNDLTNGLAKGIGRITDAKWFSNLTKKVANLKWKDHKIGFPTIIAAESLWLSAFYTISAYKNPKIEKKQKQTEAVYQTLTSIFCAIGAFSIDGIVNKAIDNFSETFQTHYNKDAVNTIIQNQIKAAEKAAKSGGKIVAKSIESESEILKKCVNGIKQLKTIVIFATIYRFIGPVIMNPVANKISGHFQNKAKQKEEATKTEKK